MTRIVLRPILLTLGLLLLWSAPAISQGASSPRFIDFDRFRSELRFPAARYTSGSWGTVRIAVSVDAEGRLVGMQIVSADSGYAKAVERALRLSVTTPDRATSPVRNRAEIAILFTTQEESRPSSDSLIVVRPKLGTAPAVNGPAEDVVNAVATEPRFSYNELATSIRYPDQARKIGLEGTVLVSAYIDVDGTPTPYVKLSDHEIFNDVALQAVRETTFIPAVSPDGDPVGAWVLIPINFELR